MAVFSGECRLLRKVSLGIVVFGLLVLLWQWPSGPVPTFAVGCIVVGAVMVRCLPWHFDVRRDGLELWFSLGRRVFLRREDVTVRVNPGSPVALIGPRRRYGYALTDGLVERRRAMLRAVLLEYGYEVV